MKLYKFRSLGTCQDLERTQEILETGKFWCSRFWELNDPMEGVYSFTPGKLNELRISDIYSQKSRHVLCSFSGEKAFENPIMWGYYANGFKGIAIEIEIEDDDPKMKEMNYSSDIKTVTNDDSTDDAVERILMTKLCCWKHEEEYRYLFKGERGYHKIGEISAVYFGNPYQTTANADAVQQHEPICKYLRRLESLKQTAKECRIKCSGVNLINGRVQPRCGE